MKVAHNIKQYRTKLKMSQDELAEKLYVTRQTVSNYENGKSEPSLETLQKMSVIFDCELNELIEGKKIKNMKQIYLNSLYVILAILTIVISKYAIMPIFEQQSALTYKINAYGLYCMVFFHPFLLGICSHFVVLIAREMGMQTYPSKIIFNILFGFLCLYGVTMTFSCLSCYYMEGVLNNVSLKIMYTILWIFKSFEFMCWLGVLIGGILGITKVRKGDEND